MSTHVTGADRAALATELRQRYETGDSIRALAESVHRSYGFIHRMLTENGVKLRARGGPRKRRRA